MTPGTINLPLDGKSSGVTPAKRNNYVSFVVIKRDCDESVSLPGHPGTVTAQPGNLVVFVTVHDLVMVGFKGFLISPVNTVFGVEIAVIQGGCFPFVI